MPAIRNQQDRVFQPIFFLSVVGELQHNLDGDEEET